MIHELYIAAKDKPIIGLIVLARVKFTILSKVLKLKDKTEKKPAFKYFTAQNQKQVI
jgi:hypothetical protein